MEIFANVRKDRISLSLFELGDALACRLELRVAFMKLFAQLICK